MRWLFIYAVSFIKVIANEQGFAMMGNLKNIRPEPKPIVSSFNIIFSDFLFFAIFKWHTITVP
jgi:hypothetical protein